MSRLTDTDLLPDDIDPYDHGRFNRASDEWLDRCEPRQPWKREDVFAYREALVKLGITGDKLEDLIERDCGSEFCERPMLLRRQAS
jgi:hypothetical protein